MVAGAGEGGARHVHRLPDVGKGQAHHPAATTGIRRLREHHRTHPQETRRQECRLPRPHTATQGAVRETEGHILSRPGPEARASARAFDLLPTTTLEVDAATVMRLIRMPEVLVVRLPRP